MRLTIPPEMVRATNFRHPPHIETGPDGNAHIYDAEEADSTRRQYDRALLSSPPNPTAPLPDHVPVYPIQQSEASPTRLPAGNFGVERPLGSHFSHLSPDPARARTTHSWSPPSTPGDPSTPPHGARSSLPWSPAGTAFNEANPAAEHESYFTQPQGHPGASPNMNQRELYYSQHYAHARTGAPGWSPRAPTSPDVAHRRISSTQQSLGSMTQNQNQPSYGSPYMDSHRRSEYDGAGNRGA